MTLPISRKAYTAILSLVVIFLTITGGVYFGILAWMSINHIEATGTAFAKLETFVAGNFGLLIGAILNPSK